MIPALPRFYNGRLRLCRHFTTCFLLLPCVVLFFCVCDALAQENRTAMPAIWNEIVQEAKRIEAIEGTASGPKCDETWKVARNIAKRLDRSSIDLLFDSRQRFEKVPRHGDQQEEVAYWTNQLAARVIATIADPEEKMGLQWALTNWANADDGRVGWDGLAIVAVDIYHDDQSRDWLFNHAVGGVRKPIASAHSVMDEPCYISLQLLRGYVPTAAMRRQFQQDLKTPLPARATNPWQITWADAVRSLVSSWDYAGGLDGESAQKRYRDFQSTLWRYHAIVSNRFRGGDTHDRTVANELATRWREGDEKYVLQMFSDATTPDEASVGVWLAEKLPNTERLEVIANSNSRQAEFAREALEVIKNTHQP